METKYQQRIGMMNNSDRVHPSERRIDGGIQLFRNLRNVGISEAVSDVLAFLKIREF